MCYLIYARLPLNAQRLDKTLLPMFLAKLADLALREACSAAAGGRFSKSVVGLYAYVGMNPGVQLVTELNTTHMSYVDLSTLALALPKRQYALQKSTAEQRLVWEMLRVLDKAQHKERDQDVARAIREMRDKALADFSRQPESGLTIYKETAREVANQVAVRATQKDIRAGGVTERGDVNNLNTRPNTPTPRPNDRQKGGGRGGGKGGGAKGGAGVKSSGNPCFKRAYEGPCGDPKCPHLHDSATIEAFKAKLGASFDEKRKKWLGAGGIGREAGPASAPAKRVHATIKGETDKLMSGSKYNHFGDGAKKGKGGSHITYSAHVPLEPRLVSYTKRFGQAAVKMAERVDKSLTRFITQRGNDELGILTNDAPLIKLDYFPASSRDVALLSMMKEDESFMTIDVSEGFTQVKITEPTYALPPNFFCEDR
jgi:hypothetical protein